MNQMRAFGQRGIVHYPTMTCIDMVTMVKLLPNQVPILNDNMMMMKKASSLNQLRSGGGGGCSSSIADTIVKF